MTKDEALDLALEALEYIYEGANNQGPHTGISWRCVAVKAEPAITAIKQARALDKKAENARELGLDYEPVECPVCKATDSPYPNCGCVRYVDSPVPVQEPVAYLCENAVGHKYFRWKKPSSTYKPIALYTTPPAAQRQWVGLTDEERNDLLDTYITAEGRARAIEHKLKEKNT